MVAQQSFWLEMKSNVLWVFQAKLKAWRLSDRDLQTSSRSSSQEDLTGFAAQAVHFKVLGKQDGDALWTLGHMDKKEMGTGSTMETLTIFAADALVAESVAPPLFMGFPKKQNPGAL